MKEQSVYAPSQTYVYSQRCLLYHVRNKPQNSAIRPASTLIFLFSCQPAPSPLFLL
jgi:hypothetical protein